MKKRILSLLMCLCLAATFSPVSVMAAPSEVTISNEAELKAFRDAVNSGNDYAGVTVKLTANIWLTESSSEQWVPIGTKEHPFRGVFEGQGAKRETIFNISIKDGEYQGLFGYIEGPNAEIRNIGVGDTGRITRNKDNTTYIGSVCAYNKGGTIWNCAAETAIELGRGSSSSEDLGHVGGICGYNDNGSIVRAVFRGSIVREAWDSENNSFGDLGNIGGICGTNTGENACIYLGSLEKGEGKGEAKIEMMRGAGTVGGICGLSNGKLIDCHNNGRDVRVTNPYAPNNGVFCDEYIGGICGLSRGPVTECSNSGRVTGGHYVGGICGESNGRVQYCNNSSAVSGLDSVGGICGHLQNEGSIQDCYNTGTVTFVSAYRDYENFGGICGYSESTIVARCYNTGAVTAGTQSQRVGGVCGHGSTIQNCYNTGAITGGSWVGGLCGHSGYRIYNSYTAGNVTATNDSNHNFTNNVCGVDNGEGENVYYLPVDGITEEYTTKATAKTAEEFASGAVKVLLQGDQKETIWDQVVGTDPYPVLHRHDHIWDAGVETIPPTQATTGLKTFTCTICGQTKTEELAILGHVHTEDMSTWAKDESGHWHNCSGCGEKLSFASHSWNAGVETTAPTETETGIKTFTCTVCGQTKTEVLPATGGDSQHTHDNWDSQWTSDETGHWHKCLETGCAEIKDKAAHVYDNDQDTTCNICGYTRTVSGGDRPSSGGSSSGGTTTPDKPVTNPDGSTTTTEDKTTGTVTETTKKPDGSQTVVETKKDGTVTTKDTDKDGNKTETVAKPDGSSVTKVEQTDGTTASVSTDTSGKVEAEVALPAAVVDQAQKAEKPVALPIPEVKATTNANTAPVVTVKTGSADPVKVEIPTADVTPGTVAVIVNADGSEEVIKTSVPTENGLTVALPDGATVKIVDNSKSFADVPTDSWAADAVNFSASRELFSGTGVDSFSPEEPMTRAMLMTVLARFDGADTSGGDTWYEKGMDWAVANGVSDGSAPDGNISREQLAVMLWRYSGSPAPSGSLDGFTDAGAVSGYAQEAMLWAVENGVVSGFGDGTLAPQGQATRAQVAQMMKNFITK